MADNDEDEAEDREEYGPKKSKKEANYRMTEHIGRDCGHCRHMEPDGTCERVMGKVERDYVCNYFQAGRDDDEK